MLNRIMNQVPCMPNLIFEERKMEDLEIKNNQNNKGKLITFFTDEESIMNVKKHTE